MDSKSIPRKGVGVRLPSLAPARAEEERRAAAQELAHVLVPALCRRLRAATVELLALEARLRRAPRSTLRDEALARRQEELSQELRRGGYCLGVLGAGARADLLRGRRERAGLRWMGAELELALGVRLEPGADTLPGVAQAGDGGWSFVLAGAFGLFAAVESGATPVRFRVTADELVIELARRRMPARLARRCRALSAAGGCTLTPRTGELALALS